MNVEKTYDCSYCSYKTNRPDNLKRHLATPRHKERVENPIQRFVCSCGRIYSHNSGLWRHKQVCELPKIQNLANEIENFRDEFHKSAEALKRREDAFHKLLTSFEKKLSKKKPKKLHLLKRFKKLMR